MIDLRSDTLTLPNQEMLETILRAQLGDDGRVDSEGRGEDLTVNELEDLSAELTGLEMGLLLSSGTLANTTAILTYCKPGDKVLVDEIQHIYKSEKVVFDPVFGQLKPVFYKLNEKGNPDFEDLNRLLEEEDVSLLCIENTHNFSGGAITDLDNLKNIYELAKKHDVPVHMDGARLFNAATGLNVDASEICQYVDSVMFCLSKGLGAPLGSVLCGSKDFILKAKNTRKLLGGNMRQAGIMAAPGIYALKHNIDKLKQDHENAKYLADELKDLKKVSVQKDVDSNIVMIDMQDSNTTPEQFCQMAKDRGLLIRPVLSNQVRLVFYNAITREDTIKTVDIIKDIYKLL
ncbi:MAG: low specificity L-threonine aldolase [Tissierellia bacterium]|nr:low specificity L-threonine aldolase [Tissierellia bacterium]